MAARSVIHTTDKKIAFYAPESAYKSIASDLGLKVAKDSKDLDPSVSPSDGAKGKLVRVRLNLVDGTSKTVFCAPANAAKIRKNLPGKSVGKKKIKSVTFVCN